MRIYWILPLGILLPLLIGACTMITADQLSTIPDVVDATPTLLNPVAQPTDESLILVDGLDAQAMQIVTIARDRLASKLHISTEQVAVFSVEAVTWPDGTLGCPQSTVVGTQTAVAGYLILLETGGKMYTYHTDSADQVILCEARSPGEIYNPP